MGQCLYKNITCSHRYFLHLINLLKSWLSPLADSWYPICPPWPKTLKNTPFPISASDSNFNPRNTKCIPVVKIFVFLDLGQNRTFFKGLDHSAGRPLPSNRGYYVKCIQIDTLVSKATHRWFNILTKIDHMRIRDPVFDWKSFNAIKISSKNSIEFFLVPIPHLESSRHKRIECQVKTSFGNGCLVNPW